MPKRELYILLIYISCLQASAQGSKDSASPDSVKIIQIYYQSLGEQSPLYNGSEYIEYAYTIQEGHPFFGSPGFVNGTIHFDGMTFDNVPMFYDIVKDEVVILDHHNYYKINLPADKIRQFEMNGHTFIRLLRDSSNEINTGFYELLYNGKISLFAKREKKILQQYSNMQINNVVFSQNMYYIRKQNAFYPVKNKSSLLNILKDKSKQVQQYLKKNKIKFKHDPEKATIMGVQYYDQLTM
ncbi:MAG TPA: hypothetical protein VFP87_03735 [Chitinophagaceae bacterium]|nr:hypothetical protein [Chitinophagaceae bacterium]